MTTFTDSAEQVAVRRIGSAASASKQIALGRSVQMLLRNSWHR